MKRRGRLAEMVEEKWDLCGYLNPQVILHIWINWNEEQNAHTILRIKHWWFLVIWIILWNVNIGWFYQSLPKTTLLYLFYLSLCSFEKHWHSCKTLILLQIRNWNQCSLASFNTGHLNHLTQFHFMLSLLPFSSSNQEWKNNDSSHQPQLHIWIQIWQFYYKNSLQYRSLTPGHQPINGFRKHDKTSLLSVH